ncbi:hypothetical protein [Nissabacter sp. SGAir0207]|uniref:hypothetical protein n=1 Tax=Nissabacter sp. SGAir0207 TaxID=2126321 RepID=UPI0010CD40D7|nr:hypothetical protein [Nissabacter sp. SGAir0207]QCR35691.1 hypothetical protein C1N62_06130 [Nissabacter sp. SGAir0207]
MAHPDQNQRRYYTLYLAENHVLARNGDQHLIDLGLVEQEPDGLHYLLDGDKTEGHGLPDANALLADVERKLTFLFLDGQFTSLPDLSEELNESLEGAPSREIALDELASGLDEA